jgi:hypothetical protein
MKSYCIKQEETGTIFKIILSEEELQKYIKDSDEFELVDCKEYDDAPSMVLEN